MGLFNRKKQRSDTDDQNGERKKEKGSWRRPASKSRQSSRSFPVPDRSNPRYRFQATASESMAAHPDPQNRFAYVVYHWHHIRPNRRSARVGKQLGMPFIHSQLISLTILPMSIIASLSFPFGIHRCLK